jgi:uncharacterized protein with NAD-binding domain and iron-sulfur cluster
MEMAETAKADQLKVVIVGGGCAGMAAAWQLSRLPGYDVHLYERSWRLGGKGASGRDEHGRILEHGLHIWLGFYENAFRMMRECYSEVEARGWGPDRERPQDRLPHGSIDEAFFPEPHVGVAGHNRAQEWEVWSGDLPPMKGRPGDPIDPESNPFTLVSYLARCFHLVKTLMLSIVGPPGGEVPGKPRPEERSNSDEAVELDFSFDAARSPRVLVDRMARMLRGSVLTTAAGVLQGVTILEDGLRTLKLAPQATGTVLEFVEAVAAQTRKLLRDVVAVDERLRWKTELIDIVITIAVGLYRDRVLFDKRGLDAINHIDYRDWLIKHGATKTAVDSPFMKGIYDLVFAYRNGDHDKRALAAGVALRGALRMFFTYRGAMFFRMRSGMGDAVFSPLYRVLREGTAAGDRPARSPVTFHFLHALSRVELDFEQEDEGRVTRLDFTTRGDPAALDAISRTAALDHFGCWPDDERLFADAASKKGEGNVSLRADKDFDAVIFAMGIDDFVKVWANGANPGTDLFRLPQWSAMRKHVKTAATKAAQVWLNRDLDELGWHRGPGLISALGTPFGTWADMTHTLASERAWREALAHDKKEPAPPPDGVRSVAAFCSVLSNDEVERARDSREKLRKHVERDLYMILRKGIAPFWPSAFRGRRTALDALVKSAPRQTAKGRVTGQHAQANFVGSERYTLALPGSIEHRVSPLDRSVSNMTIAGDWTACGLDAGCVEAAVMSGMLAVHAITGHTPSLDDIVGYHHP